MIKLVSRLTVLVFLVSTIAGVTLPLFENPDCDCQTECWLDVSAKRRCFCAPYGCEPSTGGDTVCWDIRRGSGAFGPLYFCMCGFVDTFGNPPEYEDAWWEAECLCRHKSEIGIIFGHCYPQCDTNTCTTTCKRLTDGEFTTTPQACCTCTGS